MYFEPVSLCFIFCRFTNYAFYSEETDITSCVRPDLLDCAVRNISGVADCEDEIYGSIDDALFEELGSFVLTENVWYLFAAENANIALDNIYVDVQYNYTASNGSNGTAECVTTSQFDDNLNGLWMVNATVNGRSSWTMLSGFTLFLPNDLQKCDLHF